MTEPQPPPPQETLIQSIIRAVTSISLTQALVIVLLAAVAIPSYLMWSLLNDPAMLGRFLSSYEEITSDKIHGVLRIASLQGSDDTYAISTGFAAQGSDQYVVSVIMDRKPSEVEIQSYCETLQLIVDHMRRPESPPPTFPGSDEELIWHYPK